MLKPKPLVPWYGGKARMAGIIADKLPPHRIYVEPFGGAAGVLMAKQPSELEIYNDLHSGIVNLFRVVRDELTCNRLLDLLEFTPYSREEWDYCNKNWELETDPVERARMLYVVLAQSFVARTKGGAWACDSATTIRKKHNSFFNSFKNIKEVCSRINQVTIENKPGMEILRRFESPDTCFYLDPPYYPETWKTGKYKHEMSVEQHDELLNFLLNSISKIILSGYPSEFYTATLESAGWVREDYEAVANSALRSSNNGLKNAPPEKFKRTECLWFSPNILTTRTLWNQPFESEAI